MHAGNKNEKTTSKTEAMYFPKPREKADPENTADIQINEDQHFSYCTKFKYLGSIFTLDLKENEDINKRISQAINAFNSMKDVLTNQEIPVKTRIRIYDSWS